MKRIVVRGSVQAEEECRSTRRGPFRRGDTDGFERRIGAVPRYSETGEDERGALSTINPPSELAAKVKKAVPPGEDSDLQASKKEFETSGEANFVPSVAEHIGMWCARSTPR